MEASFSKTQYCPILSGSLFTHDNAFYQSPKLEAAAQSVKADRGHWHSAFQKAMNRPSRIVSRIQDIHRNREFPCTNPTQPKMT
jgi:hypothetical protein